MDEKTILYLHGPLVRTSRLLLEGLSAFAAAHGCSVQRVSPPGGASTGYLRRIIEFWQPLGIVEDCGVEPGLPLPDDAFNVPFVFIDLDPARQAALAHGRAGARPSRKGGLRIGFVDADSDAFARLAARELLKRDFAAYAFVSAYQNRHWNLRRQKAFREAIGLSGETVMEFDGTGLATGLAANVRRLGKWLKELPKPCGLLAANDRTAALVLTAAARHGVTVPDMVSVVGIDDDEMLCENMSPPLTSIQTDIFRGGYLAGQLAFDLASANPKDETHLCYGAKRLVQRLSTRRLNTQAPSVRMALEEIRRRVAEGISTADILPMLGGSRRAAEKRFRAATGKSILEEILDVRFQKLMPLLEQGHIPLASLVGLTGFSSENHLQRQFKARFGMTLSDYRRKSQGEHLRADRTPST